MARKEKDRRTSPQVIDINEVIDEKQARRRFVTGRRIAIIVAVIILAIFAVISVRDIRGLQQNAADAQAELKLKEEQKANLETELAHLQDPIYIEKQARERLRMVKPGEIIYIYKSSESDGFEKSTAKG